MLTDESFVTIKNAEKVQETTKKMTQDTVAVVPPRIQQSIKLAEIGLKFVKSIDKAVPSASCISHSTGSDVKKIFILEALNPHRFWFSEIAQYNNHRKVIQQMNEFYSTNIESFKINGIDLQVGLHVAVFKSESWHRAKILKFSDPLIRVFFVDFGSVDEIELKSLRYLKEEFLNVPSIAQRGVLAFIQPKHPKNFWSNKAKNFFRDNLSNKTVSAKFFYVNSFDNSYYISIKPKANSSVTEELFADQMIEKELGALDTRFLMRGSISQNEISFDEYENGKWFELDVAFKLQNQDSWVPKVKSGCSKTSSPKSKVESPAAVEEITSFRFNRARLNHQHAAQVQTSQQPTTLSAFVKNPMQRANVPNDNRGIRSQQFLSKLFMPSTVNAIVPTLNPQFQKIEESNGGDGFRSPDSITSLESPRKCKNITDRQIAPQNFETLSIGREILITIHKFDELCQFFFYNSEEALEIKHFLDSFKWVFFFNLILTFD